ncbi:MAG: RlmE family RNA methyltransferase [Rhodospirillaceae bacterium]|nr:RlmE family RNA methyltransferase [Rhodospirillaceae bacterium]
MKTKRGSSKPGGAGRGPTRGLKVRVKSARGRKISSTRWLERQLNDPYVRRAKDEGYRSRAAFKLIELDDRFRILKPGLKVVDLGAAPGGWTQVAVARVKAGDKGGGKVVGLDINPWADVPQATCLTMDFMDERAPDALKAALGGKADVVLSDMAAPTTGHSGTDHLRIMALVEAAWMFAEDVLAPGGAFICKVFQGGTEGDLLKAIKAKCAVVKHAKPPASRKESSEVYVVATGFKG